MNRRLGLIFGIFLLSSSTAFAQATQEKSVTVFGAKINYVELGDTSKPKVIFLHGLGGSRSRTFSHIDDLSVAKSHWL